MGFYEIYGVSAVRFLGSKIWCALHQPDGRHRLKEVDMPRGFGAQISPIEQRVLPSRSRTFYEAAAWGDLSTKEIEAMHGRIDAACPDIACAVKIRSIEAGLVIEIPGIATDEQIARLRQWLLGEAALRAGPTTTPPEASD
jgi:hypothetical protein